MNFTYHFHSTTKKIKSCAKFLMFHSLACNPSSPHSFISTIIVIRKKTKISRGLNVLVINIGMMNRKKEKIRRDLNV